LNFFESVLCDLCGADTLHTESPLSNHFLVTGHWRWPEMRSFGFYHSKSVTNHRILLLLVNTSYFTKSRLLAKSTLFMKSFHSHVINFWVDIQGLCGPIIKYFWYFINEIYKVYFYFWFLQTFMGTKWHNFWMIVFFNWNYKIIKQNLSFKKIISQIKYIYT
jgi:hypothetical protein